MEATFLRLRDRTWSCLAVRLK